MRKNIEEIWKDIEGFDNLYQISNCGRVRSLDRIAHNGQRIKGKILKTNLNKCGYYTVNLYKNKKMKTCTIHRLVANSFIPNPDNLPCVNHKNEDKKNNYDFNLEWCTVKYNNIYGTRIQKVISNTDYKKAGLKISVKLNQYDKSGKFIKKWDGARIAERELNIDHSHIAKCCKGKKKTAGGYIWRYENDDNEMVLNDYKGMTHKKKVNKLDEKGNIIDKYESACEAARANSYRKGAGGSILRCCKNTKSTAYGYHWEYAE